MKVFTVKQVSAFYGCGAWNGLSEMYGKVEVDKVLAEKDLEIKMLRDARNTAYNFYSLSPIEQAKYHDEEIEQAKAALK